jgi:hypothetical protein
VGVAGALVADASSAMATPALHGGAWSGQAADAAAVRRSELSARLDRLGQALHGTQPALAHAVDRLALLAATVRLAELASVDSGVALVGGQGPHASAAAEALADEIDADLAAAFTDVIRRLGSSTGPYAGLSDPGGAATSVTSVMAVTSVTLATSATSATSGPAVPGGWPGVGPLVEPAAGARLARGGAATLLTAVPSPPPGGDLVGWWASLSWAQRETAAGHLPELVGPADGLPGWARDRANRILLDRAETALEAEVATLEPQTRTWRDLLEGTGSLGAAATIGTFGGGARRVAYQQAVAKQAAVRATRQVLDQRDGRARQLLAFDVSERTARVAVAVGDVDRSAHLAVVVPGFTTTVERDLAGTDRVSADLADQSRRAATLVGDHRDVAVVSWLGYDIPQTADTLRSGHSVVLRASAEAGAARLAAFLRGLPPEGHVTLVGHSYGSTTAGLAVARGDTGVDDLVVLGSPGLGADSSTELGLPFRQVHVLEADGDPVADLGWFGRDPSGLPGVDRLSTEDAELPDGGPGRRSVGHSGYLAPGTTSQWNVAAVVTGSPVVPAGRPPPTW